MKVKLLSPVAEGEGCPVIMTEPPFTKVGTMTIIAGNGDVKAAGITIDLDLLQPAAAGEKPTAKRRGRRKKGEAAKAPQDANQPPGDDSSQTTLPSDKTKDNVPF